jgi:hypothetical protein
MPDQPPPVPKAGAPAFTPVPVRPRRDGWTAEKQRIFIRTLAETGLVTAAARAAGMSERSAHRLALREDAESFCSAWDAALRLAARRGTSKLFEYGLEGMTETVWRDGEVVYRRRRPSEKALFFLLSHLDPVRFGRPPAASDPRDNEGEPIDLLADTAGLFDLALEALEDLPVQDEDDSDDPAPGLEPCGGEER